MKKSLAAILLSICMVFTMTPFAFADTAADTGDPSGTDTTTQPTKSVDWKVSKDATNLDKNYESDVTLSIPSPQEDLSSDIVFVVDKSSSSTKEAGEKGIELLNKLSESVETSNASVKVGVVVFDGTSHDLYPLSSFSGSDDQIKDIKYAMTEARGDLPDYNKDEVQKDYKVGGTNMQAGLEAAKKMLDDDTSVQESRKYMIMVSDGMTRLFSDYEGNVKNIYLQLQGRVSRDDILNSNESGKNLNIPKNEFKYAGDISGWAFARGIDEGNNEFILPNGWNWTDYYNQITTWVEADKTVGDIYALDYLQYKNGPDKDNPENGVYNTSTGDFMDTYFENHYIKYNDFNNHALSVDRAVYEAYKAYQSLVDSKYNCYAVIAKHSGFGDEFMGALNKLSGNKDVDFSVVQKEVLYRLGAGSYVEDVIGSDFDLKDTNSIYMEVTGADASPVKLMAEKIAENHFRFGEPENGTYEYEVTYDPEKETLKWITNVNVSNFERISLHYTVKLASPETKPGEYGQLDLDGDTKIDKTQTDVVPEKALYTNEKATLNPKDSQEKDGIPVDFPKPSVTYTVEAPYVPPAPTVYYTLTYVTNGGNDIAPETYISGKHVDITKTPTRRGYEFTGWYSDEALTKPVESVTMDRDRTVYAGWKKSTPEELEAGNHVAYIAGYPDGTVQPMNNITRDETAAIIFRLLKEDIRNANLTNKNGFKDFDSSEWANVEISTLVKMGIIHGRSDEEFAPKASITRAEFATMFASFSDMEDPQAAEAETPAFSDISGHWAEKYINRAAQLGWIAGFPDGTFHPDDFITRAEASSLINSVLLRVPSTADHLIDGISWPDNSDTSAWYYIDMQEATNSHDNTREGLTLPDERWTKIVETPDWNAMRGKLG